MKPWKTSSATNETRSARPSFRLDSQWSGYGPILPQGTSRKPENRPGSRGLAICSLPDFPEFAQAVRYGVPGTQLAAVNTSCVPVSVPSIPLDVPQDGQQMFVA